MKNIISQIQFIANLIKFIWIIVLALQVGQKAFALGLGLTYHKYPRSLFQSLGCWVLGPMYNKHPRSWVPLLGSWVFGLRSQVPPMNWVLSLRSRVPLLGFWVSGNRSHLWVGSRVSGVGSHQKSRVSGLTFRICRFDIIFTFLGSVLVIKLFRPF